MRPAVSSPLISQAIGSSIRLWILGLRCWNLSSLILETYSPPTTGRDEPVLGSPVCFLGSALLEGLRCPGRQLPAAQGAQLCLERGLGGSSAHPPVQEGCTGTPAGSARVPRDGHGHPTGQHSLTQTLRLLSQPVSVLITFPSSTFLSRPLCAQLLVLAEPLILSFLLIGPPASHPVHLKSSTLLAGEVVRLRAGCLRVCPGPRAAPAA